MTTTGKETRLSPNGMRPPSTKVGICIPKPYSSTFGYVRMRLVPGIHAVSSPSPRVQVSAQVCWGQHDYLPALESQYPPPPLHLVSATHHSFRYVYHPVALMKRVLSCILSVLPNCQLSLTHVYCTKATQERTMSVSRSPTSLIPVVLSLTTLLRAVQRSIRTARLGLITESIDPAIFELPRNLTIFPNGLGSWAQSTNAAVAPLVYSLQQLIDMFRRAYREEDHIENIYVSSARYCKQPKDAKHEFIILEVRDNMVPKIANFLVLDRTVQGPATKGRVPVSASISTSILAQDRLRVSYYGDTRSLLKSCDLHNYNELARLEFSPSNPFFLYELVILASATSNTRQMYNLYNAQCFWFAGSVWDCMRVLRKDAQHTQSEQTKIRGSFGPFFSQKVDGAEQEDILYKVRHEIAQFKVELKRGQEVSRS
jgi:hypothetical protein